MHARQQLKLDQSSVHISSTLVGWHAVSKCHWLYIESSKTLSDLAHPSPTFLSAVVSPTEGRVSFGNCQAIW